MSEKPYREMNEAELREALAAWVARVDDAAGWASADLAAKQCEAIVKIARRKGIAMHNPRMIIHGSAP